MKDLPADLLAALPESGRDVAAEWWQKLSDAERARIADLWDQRLEVCFFQPQSEDGGCLDSWDQVPKVQGGKYVPSDDDGRHEWEPGYFEHLLQHPELVMAYDPFQRTFHVGCTQHPDARHCLSAGAVFLNFECPLASATCPLSPLRGARLAKRH